MTFSIEPTWQNMRGEKHAVGYVLKHVFVGKYKPFYFEFCKLTKLLKSRKKLYAKYDSVIFHKSDGSLLY